MRIDVGISREKAAVVIDHLRARLRKILKSSTSRAWFNEDGSFSSSLEANFPIGDKEIFLTWAISKNAAGEITHIDINANDSIHGEWEKEVDSLWRQVLVDALNENKNRYFRRRIFKYIGPHLDGEYWLPGNIRFSPVLPTDDEPRRLDLERVVSLDFHVEAIDESTALGVANEVSHRLGARISLLLDTGLYHDTHGHRWVAIKTADNHSQTRIDRCQPAHPKENAEIHEMPKKGAYCQLGQYSTSLRETVFVGTPFGLPKETRKILRGIDGLEPRISEAFDGCARLYQVALVLGTQFPSVGLAYRVAAVEALSQGDPNVANFKDFIQSYANLDSDKQFEQIWHTVRCSHFHAGAFPYGEYEMNYFDDRIIDAESAKNMNMKSTVHDLTRKAIVNWLYRNIPELAGVK